MDDHEPCWFFPATDTVVRLTPVGLGLIEGHIRRDTNDDDNNNVQKALNGIARAVANVFGTRADIRQYWNTTESMLEVKRFMGVNDHKCGSD